MVDFLTAAVTETARVLYEGSFYILIGFFVAGLLHAFMPTQVIARHLGQDNPRSVILAALFGAPIPLCSCGVLPAAAALRKKGASRSSLMSFLVSTPETGVDSIAITYGLLGPIMAVVRPIVAIVTAIAAGMASIFWPGEEGEDPPDTLEAPPNHDHSAEDACDDATQDPSWRARADSVLRYGFSTLLDEIAFWLIVGVVLTGVLSALLPDDFFSGVLGWDGGILPMLAMVVAGVPLYLCASASTPVAAALIAKGLSPGAALVFLLVGPATNAATIAVVGQLLGPWRLRIYLTSIIGVSLAAGLLLDAFAADSIRVAYLSGTASADSGVWVLIKLTSALAFVALLVLSFHRTRFRDGRKDLGDQLRRVGHTLRNLRAKDLLRPPVLGAAIALLVLLWLPTAVLIVEPGQRGIVLRFGRAVATELEPGFHLHLPAPLSRGIAVDTDRIRQVPVGFRETPRGERLSVADQAFYLTADENIVDIRSVVNYRVVDAARFALGVERSDALIASLARRELVAATRRRSIETLYTRDRRSTEADYRSALQARVTELDLGIEVVDVRILDVHAPATVHDAFRDVASALEDRERAIHQAGGDAAVSRAQAVGESASITNGARALALRSRVLAESNTAAFARLAAVHRQHPHLTERRLHFETLDRSLAKPRKYINAAGGAHPEIDLWIGASRSGELDSTQPRTPVPPLLQPGREE